jgi:hypothetical protein
MLAADGTSLQSTEYSDVPLLAELQPLRSCIVRADHAQIENDMCSSLRDRRFRLTDLYWPSKPNLSACAITSLSPSYPSVPQSLIFFNPLSLFLWFSVSDCAVSAVAGGAFEVAASDVCSEPSLDGGAVLGAPFFSGLLVAYVVRVRVVEHSGLVGNEETETEKERVRERGLIEPAVSVDMRHMHAARVAMLRLDAESADKAVQSSRALPLTRVMSSQLSDVCVYSHTRTRIGENKLCSMGGHCGGCTGCFLSSYLG